MCIQDTNFLSNFASSFTDHWLQINNVSKTLRTSSPSITSKYTFRQHIKMNSGFATVYYMKKVMEERVSTKRGEGGNFKEWMRYWEKNEGKVGALWPARLSFQECIWLWLMSTQRSAVAGAPAHFQGPQGRKRGKWGNREQWARVRLPVMDFTWTIPSD